MAIRLTENRLKEILGASFVGVDLFSTDLAVDLASIGGDASDWTTLIQGFTPDVNPSLSTQYGANRAGQTVSQTAQQLHQRIVNVVASTVHRLSPFFDALPGVTVFTADVPITATIKLESYAPYPIGSEVQVIQGGDGPVTINVDSGVSLFPASPVTSHKGGTIRLLKYGSNAWLASGNASGVNNFFSAYLSSTSSNVTGNGTPFDVPFNAELTDPGANFASSVFTAPSSGAYQFQAQVRINGITAAADMVEISIIPSAGVTRYARWEKTNDILTDKTYPASGIIVLAAGATVKVTAEVTGEASNVCDVVGAGAPLVTSFDGFKLGGG